MINWSPISSSLSLLLCLLSLLPLLPLLLLLLLFASLLLFDLLLLLLLSNSSKSEVDFELVIDYVPMDRARVDLLWQRDASLDGVPSLWVGMSAHLVRDFTLSSLHSDIQLPIIGDWDGDLIIRNSWELGLHL